METTIRKPFPRQQNLITNRVGDQLYICLGADDGHKLWGAFCAADGLQALVYWQPAHLPFAPSRRCQAHSAIGVRVRNVVRVSDDETLLEVLAAAKSEIEKVAGTLTDRADLFPDVATALLRKRVESGTAAPPVSREGSGWFRPFAGGAAQFCDVCAKFSVVVRHPREQPDWKLVRCRNCRNSNRRSPSAFAATLTPAKRNAVFKAAVKAVEQEASRWGSPPMTEIQRREALADNARLALRVLGRLFREEHGS